MADCFFNIGRKDLAQSVLFLQFAITKKEKKKSHFKYLNLI